jgi:two-component system, sensor histidine kinase RegB
MLLPTLIRPQVYAQPTLDTAIWFLHLRWLAVFGQLLTLAVVHFGLRVPLPVGYILLLVSVTALTNLAYRYWLVRLHRRGLELADRLPTDQVISALMLIDLLDLTGLLYLSAGISNPFWLFYFVNIAMAAAIIAPGWAWLLWACTVGCVCLLLAVEPRAIAMLGSPFQHSEVAGTPNVLQLGYLVSFAACSGIITHFITILTGELRMREQAIKDAEDAKSRNRQLESLATLAAGAAHELSSPLSTIAVVAKELGRTLEKQQSPSSAVSDVVLIRSELDRCRQILDRMTAATGEAAGERLRSIGIEEFLEESVLGIREADLVAISLNPTVEGSLCLLPVQAAAQSIRNLIQNALDASPENTPVQVIASLKDQSWLIEIVDRGTGMPEAVLQRLGEPFFTTKEPGKGMGLGVYLAMNVIRRLGGNLSFSSQPGQGTRAQVYLPLNP